MSFIHLQSPPRREALTEFADKLNTAELEVEKARAKLGSFAGEIPMKTGGSHGKDIDGHTGKSHRNHISMGKSSNY